MTASKHPRRTRAQWIKLVEAKRHSNLTTEEYCRQNQITVSSFYAWRSKLNKQSTGETSGILTEPNNDWLPIKLSSPVPVESSWDIELALPGGITLRMKSA